MKLCPKSIIVFTTPFLPKNRGRVSHLPPATQLELDFSFLSSRLVPVVIFQLPPAKGGGTPALHCTGTCQRSEVDGIQSNALVHFSQNPIPAFPWRACAGSIVFQLGMIEVKACVSLKMSQMIYYWLWSCARENREGKPF